MSHVSPHALESYVMGLLDEQESALVEAHVAECSACAGKLVAEAQMEVAFSQVAEVMVVKTQARTRRSSVVLGGALAMAAALALFLFAPAGARGGESTQAEPSAAFAAPAAFDHPSLVEADASTASAQLDVSADAALKLGRD